MSLGLFNCRLIQPAGDQLFFFSAVLPLPVPVRASSVQSPCDPSCSAPTNGRAQNASCLSFPERFCFGFQRGEVPSGAEGFTPTDSPANFPEDPPILPTDSAIEPEFKSYLLTGGTDPGPAFATAPTIQGPWDIVAMTNTGFGWGFDSPTLAPGYTVVSTTPPHIKLTV